MFVYYMLLVWFLFVLFFSIAFCTTLSNPQPALINPHFLGGLPPPDPPKTIVIYNCLGGSGGVINAVWGLPKTVLKQVQNKVQTKIPKNPPKNTKNQKT